MWRDDILVRERGVTKNYIDVIIEDGVSWRFTGFYGEPEWNRMHMSWDVQRSIKGDLRSPWLVMGDFNEILYNLEEVDQDHKDICRRFMMYWWIVNLMIWVSGVIGLLGKEG